MRCIAQPHRHPVAIELGWLQRAGLRQPSECTGIQNQTSVSMAHVQMAAQCYMCQCVDLSGGSERAIWERAIATRRINIYSGERAVVLCLFLLSNALSRVVFFSVRENNACILFFCQWNLQTMVLACCTTSQVYVECAHEQHAQVALAVCTLERSTMRCGRCSIACACGG